MMVGEDIYTGCQSMGANKIPNEVGSSEELYECRNCGENLTKDVDVCPNCNRQEVAYYVLKMGSSEELYECRNCGEKYAMNFDNCPNCGRQEIAYYRF